MFPIAWYILYTLMGISLYLVSKSENSKKSFILYFIQLFINSIWTLFFFKFEMYLFSFILIVVLVVLVSKMIYEFYKINKTAAYLQIPSLLWLIFAGYLNFFIFLANK